MIDIRVEQLHPLFIHFPIVFLILAPILKLTGILIKKYQRELRFTYLVSLCLGLIGLLVSLYFGDIAFAQIKSEVCQFQLVHRHEDLAYYCVFAFVIALLFELLVQIWSKEFMSYLAFLPLIIGQYFLIETSHLGAKMVYDHAIGTKASSLLCD